MHTYTYTHLPKASAAFGQYHYMHTYINNIYTNLTYIHTHIHTCTYTLTEGVGGCWAISVIPGTRTLFLVGLSLSKGIDPSGMHTLRRTQNLAACPERFAGRRITVV